MLNVQHTGLLFFQNFFFQHNILNFNSFFVLTVNILYDTIKTWKLKLKFQFPHEALYAYYILPISFIQEVRYWNKKS